MDKRKHREALKDVVAEYEALSEERATIDARLEQLLEAIGSLSQLCGVKPTVSIGLTDACRIALKAVDYPLTASEIRVKLDAMGCNTSRYSNALGSIHVVLRRLCRSGEAAAVGSHAFAWNRWPSIGAPPKKN